ncbi:MAG: AAA family ATPase [Actinobacteria bacterium]|nr:AAA family ATPase [Actinomycetota bacterium]
MDLTPYRRYGRWAKRAAWILTIYLVVAYILIGVSPRDALLNPAENLANYRGFIVQAMVLMSFIILQFTAMFWFLARGNNYVIYPGEYDVSFDDVRGQPAAVRSTKEVLRLFQGFKDFKEMGGYPPHGILFEGPPGTGKTLMAKAIAGATGVPFLYATGSGFANMFIGIGNLKVRRMFSKARAMSDKYGGAVIFIDELDALGGSRGMVSQRAAPPPDRDTNRFIVGAGMGGGGGMGIVNELLVQMDGLVVPRGMWRHVRRILLRAKPKVPFYNILIIGATNRASTLDPALLRPGRFDRKIHVGLPDSDGRADIARYYLAKVRHEPIDFEKLARMTKGYSPAMLKNIVNEALIFSLQEGRDALRWEDLWQAKVTEEIGLKQPVVYTPREKEMVAIHESAHAAVSYTLHKGERQVQIITIQKREGALGLVSSQDIEDSYLDTQKQILADIQVSLAGLVAEDIWFGQTTSGPSSDLQAATFRACLYVGLYGMGKSLVSTGVLADPTRGESFLAPVLNDPERRKEVDAILNECRIRARRLLEAKRHVVEGLRDALLEREELIGDEIEAVMAHLGEREPLDVDVPLDYLFGNGEALGEGEDRERQALPAGRPDGDGNGRGEKPDGRASGPRPLEGPAGSNGGS